MKERPILFSGAMVRALLDGSKTQTRRIVKPAPPDDDPITAGLYHPTETNRHGEESPGNEVFGAYTTDGEWARPCPYGQPGDRLWVRESYADVGCRLTYMADLDDGAHCKVKKWTPSIHMFRADSRIQLEIVSVRVERLNDISEGDCWAEGIAACDGMFDDMAIIDSAKRMGRSFEDAAPTYAALWESIKGAGSWDANPWVWVVEFRRV